MGKYRAEYMRKIRGEKHNIWYNTGINIISTSFLIFLLAIAGGGWLIEHLYNFFIGKGWTGYPFK